VSKRLLATLCFISLTCFGQGISLAPKQTLADLQFQMCPPPDPKRYVRIQKVFDLSTKSFTRGCLIGLANHIRVATVSPDMEHFCEVILLFTLYPNDPVARKKYIKLFQFNIDSKEKTN